MGLRVPTATAASPDSSKHKRPASSSKASPPDPKHAPDQEADKQARSASLTHCSASSLHAHGRHTKGSSKQGSPLLSADGAKPAVCRVREASADSEEVKTSSSVERDSGSPETSSPASALRPRAYDASCTQQDGSGELQSRVETRGAALLCAS